MGREHFQKLSEPIHYILLSLIEECCDADIMKKVKDISKGRVIVGPGTLYTLLSKLEISGLICQTAGNGRGKSYIITNKGKQMLQTEQDGLKQIENSGKSVVKKFGMKNIYRKLFYYNYTECDALKEYLEEMALKGWILKDIKTFLTFEKGEPQKIIYSVEIFDKASAYDLQPENEAIEYINYCESYGWQYVSSRGKFYIFKTNDEDTVPIETDEKEKYKTIVKNTFKLKGSMWFILSLIILFNFKSFWDYKELIVSDLSIFMVIYFCFICLTGCIEICYFVVWALKAKKRLKNNEKIIVHNKNNFKKLSIFYNIYIIISAFLLIYAFYGIISNKDKVYLTFLVGVIFILIIAFFIRKLLIRQKVSTKIQYCIITILCFTLISLLAFSTATIILNTSMMENKYVYKMNTQNVYKCGDDIPLTITDIKGLQYENNKKSIKKSVFAALTTYTSSKVDWQSKIEYEIFESKFDWIINKYVESMTIEYLMQPDDIGMWKANAVYTNKNPKSEVKGIVVYEDKVIVLSGDFSLSEAEIKTITEKLSFISNT
ncbi:MAG: hypothetical protein DBX47_07255 [Clostridiales bacterium]|nr:MAG: hypothetical protein DBX47_07255 [Clostridiales bacterium]